MIYVYHHNDPDGKAAAAVVNYWNNGTRKIQFTAVDYNQDIYFPTGDLSLDSLYVVDFSFTPGVMEIARKLFKQVIWIDHHKTAAALPYQDLPGLRNFADKQVAGCELTWEHLFPGIAAPAAIRYIGDYDCWRHSEAPTSIMFYEGLRLRDHGPEAPIWDELLDINRVNHKVIEIVHEGEVALRYRDNLAAEIRSQFGYQTLFEGLPAIVVNQYRLGSWAIGKENLEAYPLGIAYVHDGRKFTVSLYSNWATIDCGVIAKKYGGGGHKGAAGFVCDTLPWKRI